MGFIRKPVKYLRLSFYSTYERKKALDIIRLEMLTTASDYNQVLPNLILFHEMTVSDWICISNFTYKTGCKWVTLDFRHSVTNARLKRALSNSWITQPSNRAPRMEWMASWSAFCIPSNQATSPVSRKYSLGVFSPADVISGREKGNNWIRPARPANDWVTPDRRSNCCDVLTDCQLK